MCKYSIFFGYNPTILPAKEVHPADLHGSCNVFIR